MTESGSQITLALVFVVALTVAGTAASGSAVSSANLPQALLVVQVAVSS